MATSFVTAGAAHSLGISVLESISQHFFSRKKNSSGACIGHAWIVGFCQDNAIRKERMREQHPKDDQTAPSVIACLLREKTTHADGKVAQMEWITNGASERGGV
ncbi:hypothetical protein MUK42_36516 [Musa troglodytarum]|uniref:Uncharacterized protein n=1 Tax=Musa troglodytarum TaxID=320322 RepID=A0A9E7FLG1_9LILI|nr:hypothetical protein MUK42_36516 [Musa troglodytarum]